MAVLRCGYLSAGVWSETTCQSREVSRRVQSSEQELVTRNRSPRGEQDSEVRNWSHSQSTWSGARQGLGQEQGWEQADTGAVCSSLGQMLCAASELLLLHLRAGLLTLSANHARLPLRQPTIGQLHSLGGPETGSAVGPDS